MSELEDLRAALAAAEAKLAAQRPKAKKRKSKAAKRGRGEGGLCQRSSDGMWVASVELPRGDDGKRRRMVVTRRDKEAARDRLLEMQAELAETGDVATDKGMTLAQWLEKWLTEIAPQRLAPKALEGHTASVRTHIIPAIGKVRLSKLAPADVRRLHRVMRAKPASVKLRDVPEAERPEGYAKLSSTTVLLAHNVLSGALKSAVQEGLIRSNPCERTEKPRKAKAVQESFTLEQAVKLLAYCATIPDGPLWATVLLTGCRRGEAIGLEPDRTVDVLDLSWQLQRIKDISTAPDGYEYRPVTGKLYLTRPKSDSGWRMVPLVEPLASIVKLARNQAKGPFVFTEWRQDTLEGPDGPQTVWTDTGRPWDPDRATRRWKDVLRAAGLPTEVTPHGARHTAVDLLREAGVPLETIRDIVGHSSALTTKGYQTRVPQAPLRAALESLGALLGSKAEPQG